MVLKVIGSSSSGNCYIFQAETETLIVEAGVRIADIKKALHWNICNVVGCLISHRHKDHSLSVGELQKLGIITLANEDVFQSAALRNRVFTQILQPKRGYKVGKFKVFTLPMFHANNDGSECPCLAFVIEHPEMGKTLFATDTMMLKYRIGGMNHIMVEANYCDSILQENIDNGTVAVSERERLMRSHMELETTAAFLKANDLSHTNEVILLHLSSRNSAPEMFRKRIAEATGIPTYVAAKGVEINLSLTPY